MSKGIVMQEGNAFHCGECFQVYFKRDSSILPNNCKKCSHTFSQEDHISYKNLKILGGILAFDETAYRLAVKANDVSEWFKK